VNAAVVAAERQSYSMRPSRTATHIEHSGRRGEANQTEDPHIVVDAGEAYGQQGGVRDSRYVLGVNVPIFGDQNGHGITQTGLRGKRKEDCSACLFAYGNASAVVRSWGGGGGARNNVQP